MKDISHNMAAKKDKTPGGGNTAAGKAAAPAKSHSAPKDVAPKGPALWWETTVQFLREVKTELKKVTWPSRKQTISSTGVVLVLVIIVAAFLGLVDMVLVRLVRLLIS